MKNKILIYVVIGIILLAIIGGVLFSLGVFNEDKSKDFKPEQTNPELEKYRLEDIPEDCRLPDYDDDVKKWIEHLSHHGETQYCLKYYE